MANAFAQVPPGQQVVVEKVPEALPNQVATTGNADLSPMVPVFRDGSHTEPAYIQGSPRGKPVDICMYSAGPGLWLNRLIALKPTEAADSFGNLVVRILQRAQGHPIRTLELVIPDAQGNALRMGEEDALYVGERVVEQKHLETLQRLQPMFAADGTAKVIIWGNIEESLRVQLETAFGVPVEVNANFQTRKPRPLGTMEAKK